MKGVRGGNSNHRDGCKCFCCRNQGSVTRVPISARVHPEIAEILKGTAKYLHVTEADVIEASIYILGVKGLNTTAVEIERCRKAIWSDSNTKVEEKE